MRVQFIRPVPLAWYRCFQFVRHHCSWILGGYGDGNPEQQKDGKRAELARDIITFLSITARTYNLHVGPAVVLCSFLASKQTWLQVLPLRAALLQPCMAHRCQQIAQHHLPRAPSLTACPCVFLPSNICVHALQRGPVKGAYCTGQPLQES